VDSVTAEDTARLVLAHAKVLRACVFQHQRIGEHRPRSGLAWECAISVLNTRFRFREFFPCRRLWRGILNIFQKDSKAAQCNVFHKGICPSFHSIVLRELPSLLLVL